MYRLKSFFFFFFSFVVCIVVQQKINQIVMYSAPIYWQVHARMLSNNETVYRQMPWTRNHDDWLLHERKTMMLNVDRCCTWPDFALEDCQRVSQNLLLIYNNSNNDWSLGEKWILFPSNLNVSLDFCLVRHCDSRVPSGPAISFKCCSSNHKRLPENATIGGHFRVPLCLCLKTSLIAKPFLWKWLWFAWKWTYGRKSFSYQLFRTYTDSFYTEAKRNSEMAN